MKKFLQNFKFFTFVLGLILIASVANAATRTASVSGNWNNIVTWGGASVPANGDDVIINTGITVTVDVNTNAIATLTINGTGIVTIGNDNTNRTVTVTGTITISSTGTFQSAGNGGNVLNIGGNLANSGTFDMNIGAADADVTFNGTANQTVSGTGGTTDFNLITINNTGAANANIVEVSSTNFTVATDFLTLTDGILKLSGSYTLSNNFFTAAGYNIVAAAGLWLNNANVTVSGQNGSPNIDGSIRITAGTYNVGTNAGNILEMDNGSTFSMEGGTMNIAARFQAVAADAITFDMSGGTLNLVTVSTNTNGNRSFQISSASSSFTMSGGTIVVEDANQGTGGDYENLAGTVNITGGTVQFGNANTGSGVLDDFDIIGASKFPSFTIVDNATSVPTITLGASGITSTGGITINTGTSLLANSQSISLTGSWTNDGTFTPGTQTTTFNGSSAQTIGGTTATAFSSLTINNTSGGVSLGQDIFVSGAMTFTSGVVTSSATNILTFNDAATVSGATNASYVDGPVIKLGNDDFTFPVGDPLGSYHRLRLVNTGGADGDSYTAEYFRASARALGTSVAAPLYGVSNCEYWILSRNSGTNNPNLFVSWTADSDCGGLPYTTSLTGLTVARLNGAAWELANGTNQAATGTVGVTGDGTVADNGISLFGTFALGNTSPEQNPLPVTFDDVKAFEKGAGVQIEWSNLTEKDVLNYVVERSANGRDFTTISQLASRSNLSDKQSYLSFDGSPLSGTNYYRIKVVEIDGKVIYSKVLKVEIGKNVKGIILYPNPVTGSDISIGFTAVKGQYTLRVINNAGQQVYSKQIVHPGGTINQTVTLPSSLNTGVYNLMISGDNYSENKKFIMQ